MPAETMMIPAVIGTANAVGNSLTRPFKLYKQAPRKYEEFKHSKDAVRAERKHMTRMLSDESDWSKGSGHEVGEEIKKCDVELALPQYKDKVMTRKPVTMSQKWHNVWNHYKIEEGKGMMDLRLIESREVVQRHEERAEQRERSAKREERRQLSSKEPKKEGRKYLDSYWVSQWRSEKKEHDDEAGEKMLAPRCTESMASSMVQRQKEFGSGDLVMILSNGHDHFRFGANP
jgi:hypothetical protein